MAQVRYIVDDVEAAIGFYAGLLDFAVVLHPAPSFAILRHGDLQLMVSAISGPGGGSQPMPDGRVPEPGGWNRIMIEVSDLGAAVERLRGAVELFEPLSREP